MKKLLFITLLAFTLTSCFTTKKCKAQDYIDWIGNPASLGYGALYNWYAASNANFAPAGWHVPTKAEMSTLRATIDPSGNDDSGNIAGTKLKEAGTVHWNTGNTGTNDYGFNMVGSGYRGYSGAFASLKEYGQFATTTIESTYNWVQANLLRLSNALVVNSYFSVGDSRTFKYGTAIRLIKDSGTATTVTDYDGNVYLCVTIGTQTWTASNWKCTKLNDGTAIPNITDNTAWAGLTTGAYCYYNNDIGNK